MKIRYIFFYGNSILEATRTVVKNKSIHEGLLGSLNLVSFSPGLISSFKQVLDGLELKISLE